MNIPLKLLACLGINFIIKCIVYYLFTTNNSRIRLWDIVGVCVSTHEHFLYPELGSTSFNDPYLNTIVNAKHICSFNLHNFIKFFHFFFFFTQTYNTQDILVCTTSLIYFGHLFVALRT